MTTDLDQLLSRCREVEAAGRTAPQPSRAMWDADRIARDLLFLPLVECAAALHQLLVAELAATALSETYEPESAEATAAGYRCQDARERAASALSALEKAGKESGL